MKTEILKAGQANIKKAAALIKAGEIVVFPTETVYGIGANAFDEKAVAKIFAAKGRPADNPLIVHVHDYEGLLSVAAGIPDTVKRLVSVFGPSPLTYIVKKNLKIPGIVSAGLETVAARIPSHPAALALLRECGLPLAAPSANLSGRPSPTAARHVYADLNGRIPLILDGGGCGIGVESTVVDFTAGTPVILRPGGLPRERLEEVLGRKVMLHKGKSEASPKSPGLKYRHYAPRCRVIALPFNDKLVAMLHETYDFYVQKGQKAVILCSDIHCGYMMGREYVSLGGTAESAAKSLFASLREAEDKYDVLICHMLQGAGAGLAFNDRLLRAAENTKL